MKSIVTRLASACMLATFSLAVYAAEPASVEATEHAAKADYKAAEKQAKANYKAAKESCKSLGGNEKDVCIKKAKADYTAAEEDAKAKMKSTHAKSEATEDKMTAQYNLEKEKCDALSGDAKDACVASAKAKYKQ
jgi:hypothetical protein